MVNFVELRGKTRGYCGKTGEDDSGINEEGASFFLEADFEGREGDGEANVLFREGGTGNI